MTFFLVNIPVITFSAFVFKVSLTGLLLINQQTLLQSYGLINSVIFSFTGIDLSAGKYASVSYGIYLQQQISLCSERQAGNLESFHNAPGPVSKVVKLINIF